MNVPKKQKIYSNICVCVCVDVCVCGCACFSFWRAHSHLFPQRHSSFLLYKNQPYTDISTELHTAHSPMSPCFVRLKLAWMEIKLKAALSGDSDVSLCLSMLNGGQVFSEWMAEGGGVRALWQNCKAAEWTDVSQWLMFLPALPQRSCVPMHL